MKARKYCAVLCLLVTACANGAEKGTIDTATLEARVSSALEQGDYALAIANMEKLAASGDADAYFGVGYLILEWIDDPDPIEPPIHSASDALVWVRKAAALGVPQAAATLRSGYQWGRYSLAKDAKLEQCWRSVELGDAPADKCLSLETN